MKTFALLLIVVAVETHPQSAAQVARNGAYLEVGGSAVVPSVNYERRVTDRWFGRIGASVVGGTSAGESRTTFIVPLTASWISHPARNHHLEAGGGITIATGDRQELFSPIHDDEDFSSVFLTGILGYRYQKPQGGFVFRSTLTPALGDGELLPWLGFSLGYAW